MPLDSRQEPPEWVADYIGIPFVAKGRDREGCDCWGLVRLVLAERFGLDLPSYAEGYDSLEDVTAIVELIGGAQEEGAWQRVAAEEARAGDLAVLRGVPTPHIGVLVAPGIMLHALQGAQASLARLSDQAWRHRLKPTDREPYPGYYRCEASRVAARAPLRGEILTPDAGTWTLSIAPHPFRVERRTVEIPAGLSLEEAFAREQPDPLLRLHGAAWIGDQRVARRLNLWRDILPFELEPDLMDKPVGHVAQRRFAAGELIVSGTADFVIVMEDLGRLELVDQAAGMSVDQAKAAARVLADIHAAWWDDVQTLFD